jgi:hypothetical protein
LIRLYVFGDRYDVKTLRQEAVTELYYHILEKPDPKDDYPFAESIDFAFAYLDTERPLCRLLVDTVWRLGIIDLIDPDEIRSLSFMRRVWKKYRSRDLNGSIERYDGGDICDYHEHVDAAERKTCSVKSNEMIRRRQDERMNKNEKAENRKWAIPAVVGFGKSTSVV